MKMDLEAAANANAAAWRFTRVGMIACFMLASLLLVASLPMAHANLTPPDQPPAHLSNP
jgi:hypothetical protein